MPRAGVESARSAAAAHDAVCDIVAWRRIALDQQLPKARFPAGIWAPSVVSQLGLLAVAGLFLALSALTSGEQVPRAIVDSQRQVVEELVRAVNLDIQAKVLDLTDSADDFAARDEDSLDRLLARLTAPDNSWRGAAVVDVTGARTVASAGATVILPPEVEGERRAVTGRITAGEPEIVVTVPLAPGRVLAASSPLKLRSLRLNPNAQHAVTLGTAAGLLAPLQGTGHEDAETQELIRETLRRAATTGDIVSLTAGADVGQGDSGASGTTGGVAAAMRGTQLATGSELGRTGLYVVSTLRTQMIDGGAPWQGFVPVASLLLITLFSLCLTYLTLLRPVRRLALQAKADACGSTARRLNLRRPREVSRIAAGLAGRPGPQRGLPVMISLVLVCLVLLGWSAGTVNHYARQGVNVPEQVISDEANRIETASAALGTSLDLGLTEVINLSGRLRSADPSTVGSLLERTLRNQSRFRDIYLVNAAGAVVDLAGGEPLRGRGPLPGEYGIRLDQITGRTPVVYAYHARSDGSGIVAEYDLEYLTAVLRHMNGHLRVVDSGLRTILDTEGFIAFDPLRGDALRAAAITAFTGSTVSSVVSLGQPELMGTKLVSSAGVAAPQSVMHLEWVVVADRPVITLALPPIMRLRSAVLTAGVVVGLALFTLGWQYLVLVRPLRALATMADAVAAGNHDTPIPPRRQDEIGAIAACLEICRQVARDGSARSGGAARLRGSDQDDSAVIARIVAPVRPRQVPGRRH